MHPADPPISSRITLNSGRIITLHEIYQDLTYSSQLEGLPNELKNKEIVPNAIKTAKQKLYEATIPHIIRPVEKPIKTILADNTRTLTRTLKTEINASITESIDIKELRAAIGQLENNVTESKELINEFISEKKNLIIFFIAILALQGIILFYIIKSM